MKKLFLFFAILLLVFSTQPSSFADSSNFDVLKIYEHLDTLKVTDMNELDITDRYLKETFTLYRNNDVKAIKKYNEENISAIYYTEFSPVIELNTVNEKNGEISPQVYDVNKNFTRVIYRIVRDKTNKFTKEASFYLKGTIQYNPNTHKISNATNCNLSVHSMNFGSAFLPHLDNISTSSRITKVDEATFTARYSIKAPLVIEIVGLPFPFTFDFGTYTDSFSVTPDSPTYGNL